MGILPVLTRQREGRSNLFWLLSSFNLIAVRNIEILFRLNPLLLITYKLKFLFNSNIFYLGIQFTFLHSLFSLLFHFPRFLNALQSLTHLIENATYYMLNVTRLSFFSVLVTVFICEFKICTEALLLVGFSWNHTIKATENYERPTEAT